MMECEGVRVVLVHRTPQQLVEQFSHQLTANVTFVSCNEERKMVYFASYSCTCGVYPSVRTIVR